VRQLRRLDRFGWTLHVRGPWHIPAHPPDDPDVWMAYSLLARAIRLADREMSADRQWLNCKRQIAPTLSFACAYGILFAWR
jgi:hypothetical protein